jgi:hypothetical protein
MKNVTIAYNTFWAITGISIDIDYGVDQTGNTIANNIVYSNGNEDVVIDDRTNIEMFNNFWVGGYPSGWQNGDGMGDVYGTGPESAGFLNTPDYTANSYQVAPTSPAVGSASNTHPATTGITEDFESKS